MSALGLGVDDRLRLLSTQDDELGYRHYQYQQTYQGIPIEGAIYLMHEKNNRTKKANGKLIRNISIHTAPHVSEATALQTALQHVGADMYAWEDATHQALIREVEQCEEATFYPSGELVIIDPQFKQSPENYRLAYKFDIYAITPLSRQAVYIDAQNSTVLTSIERLHSCTDTPASGNSNYSGTVNFTACQESGTHTLKDHLGEVIKQVFNANNTLSEPQIPFTDSDGFFEADPTAVDVHFATQKTHEYFLNNHNRNSLDGNGTPLYSWVHYGNGYNNASWNGSWMIYGDGDNNKYSALTAPDVVAHEMTHGITEFAVNTLIYSYESGALNESFSDIFGEVVEAYIRGNNDWVIGADFTVQTDKNGIRNMSNPNDVNMLTRQPDTYLGNYWYTGAGDNGGVHFNSGVQNHWFYLLSEGGSGINDNGESYDVTGIGIDKAADIAYRNLTTYITSTSQYSDACEGAIQSAIDLYGEDSEEVLQTEAAWCAVGLGNCGVTPPSSSNCNRVQDSLALVAFYNSANGSSWTNSWDLAQPLDTWHGVILNDDGCIEELQLGNNNLSGNIAPHLGNLSSVQEINFHYNQLTGNIPSELSNLTTLVDLRLSANDLNGVIPPQLGDLGNLERLWLTSNDLSGGIPPEFGNLSKLKDLTLSSNPLEGNIPSELGSMENLESLHLIGNLLTGSIPSELGNLDNLRSLHLNGNDLSGSIPVELYNLSNLKKCWLHQNQLTGNISPQFANLSQLTDLELMDNEFSGTIPPELGNLSNLKSLSLRNNQLIGSIPAELGNLSNLLYLRLNGNDLSGCYDVNLTNLCSGLNPAYSSNSNISFGNNFDTSWEDFCATGAGSCPPLPEMSCRERDSLALVALYNAADGANWTNAWDLSQPIDTWLGVNVNGTGCVEILSLTSRQLNGSIPTEIGNLHDLMTLLLYSNQLSGSIPSTIGNLTNLTKLNLHSNDLNGSIPSEIGNLTNLSELYLHNNQLSGSIPSGIGNLTNLTKLRLSSNEFISGSIPQEIGNLIDLTYLNLNENQLGGSIPTEIGNLTNLQTLYLDSNQLSGSIPTEIGNLSALKNLWLYSNQLSGSIPSAIGNLGSIENLKLNDNQLEGEIPPEIGDLINLSNLHLHDNQLNGEIPAEIGDLSNLSTLKLDNNQLSGSIPAEIGNLSLGLLDLEINQLSGCYDVNLMNLCQSPNVHNWNVSNGNNFDASWEDFCATGAGTCAPVWPGDFNNDGVADNIDAIFWGLAAGNTGLMRPGATTNWEAQSASEWSQYVIGINGKHQDADGDGIVDIDDLDVLVQNYGETHNTPMYGGASSPIQFELRQLGTETQNGMPAIRYGVYLRSSLDVPINVHGLAFSLDLSELFVVGKPQIETSGSALVPSESIDVYNASPSSREFHIALTRTDRNNQLIIDGDLITECIVVVKDLPTNDPFEVRINGGSTAAANGNLNAVAGTSLYSLFDNGIEASLSTSVSVVHEQCYALGSASVEVLEGTPPYTYSWSTGANTAEVTHLLAGTYTVEIYDADGQQQSVSIQIDAPQPIYDQEGNEIVCSPHNSWLIPQLYAVLEGAYDANTGMMNNQLQALNFLPDSQPYQALPWNYRGTEGQGWTAADYPDSTVDWVLVSFRDVQDVDRVYAKTAALLQQDGSLFFPNSRFLSAEVTDSLHVVIQHRNHIAAMTPQPLSVDNQIIIHDFSLGDSYHPPSQYGQKQLPDGTWVMFAGDCEQAGTGYDITGDDKGLWSNNNGSFGSYYSTDLNLDGDVNGADKGLWFDNNGVNSVAPK